MAALAAGSCSWRLDAVYLCRGCQRPSQYLHSRADIISDTGDALMQTRVVITMMQVDFVAESCRVNWIRN